MNKISNVYDWNCPRDQLKTSDNQTSQMISSITVDYESLDPLIQSLCSIFLLPIWSFESLDTKWRGYSGIKEFTRSASKKLIPYYLFSSKLTQTFYTLQKENSTGN